MKILFKIIAAKALSSSEKYMATQPLYKIYKYKTVDQCVNHIKIKYNYNEKNR